MKVIVFILALLGASLTASAEQMVLFELKGTEQVKAIKKVVKSIEDTYQVKLKKLKQRDRGDSASYLYTFAEPISNQTLIEINNYSPDFLSRKKMVIKAYDERLPEQDGSYLKQQIGTKSNRKGSVTR